MASTNEDVTVLATAPLGDSRLLVMRHLPDRGTVEVGWWTREEGGAIMPGPSALELAAEAVEVNAAARFCEQLGSADWHRVRDGEALAESAILIDGAQIAAIRSATGMKLIRRPESGELVLPSQPALDLLIGMFPEALRKLGTLGFGLVQQGDPDPPGGAATHVPAQQTDGSDHP